MNKWMDSRNTNCFMKLEKITCCKIPELWTLNTDTNFPQRETYFYHIHHSKPTLLKRSLMYIPPTLHNCHTGLCSLQNCHKMWTTNKYWRVQGSPIPSSAYSLWYMYDRHYSKYFLNRWGMNKYNDSPCLSTFHAFYRNFKVPRGCSSAHTKWSCWDP